MHGPSIPATPTLARKLVRRSVSAKRSQHDPRSAPRPASSISLSIKQIREKYETKPTLPPGWLPVLFLLAAALLHAQPGLSGAPRIKQALDRLNVLGSVLLVGAHPDDENTALLATLARGRKLRTAYLSVTRGEGGQNLIGPEQGDLMGVIRTQELLAARRIDGAEQFFTRAIDFGYSKTSEETLQKWGREAALSDVVWVIRNFRPDVIILRFSGSSRDGHGHHAGSAVLGEEAFAAAADPKRFPEQLQWVQPWQARRLVWNVFGGPPSRAGAGQQNWISIDVGEYDPLLGYSYGEIAGMSRSMHRSQGMGSPERRGALRNQFTVQAGEPASADLFDGIDTSWNRLPGGARLGPVLTEAARSFDPQHPAKTIPLLLKARPLIAAIDHPWAAFKLRELDDTLALCAGLWLDASIRRSDLVPGSTAEIEATALNRSPFPITLLAVDVEDASAAPSAPLDYNQPRSVTLNWKAPASRPYTQPYWLLRPARDGMYQVDNPRLIGSPENAPALQARFRLRFDSQPVDFVQPVLHRYVDRVRGELTGPLAVVPPVALQISPSIVLFPDALPRKLVVQLTAAVAGAAGQLRLDTPPGWRVEPAAQPFRLSSVGEQAVLPFSVAPSDTAPGGRLRAVAKLDGLEVSSGVRTIVYDHIPPQTLFPPSQAELVRVDVRTLARAIGYVMGAGDEVPQSLRQLGCQVTLLDAEDLARGDLSRFDAIVTGVRAYNVRPDLRANQQRLLDYAAQGGALVVQYNVLDRGGSSALERLGPFPLRIGRSRVTVEDAPVRFPDPDHPLLRAPNRITARDFEGWIQERGLYFADQWDERYTSLWECADPGEHALPGGILYARHGKGAYIFTAYAWFRQLPAGVPGAYRIFANLLSAAKAVP